MGLFVHNCRQQTPFPYPLGPFWKDQFKSVTSEGGSVGPCQAICLVKKYCPLLSIATIDLANKDEFLTGCCYGVSVRISVMW